MYRFLLILLLGSFTYAASAEPKSDKPSDVPYDTPIKSELEKVFNGLVYQLKQADDLVAKLRATASKKPDDAKGDVDQAAQTLSALADHVAPNGDMMNQLLALRNAATVHRKRVQEMGKDIIEEQDRTAITSAWDRVIQEADKAQAAMGDMQNRLMSLLNKLRMRQSAITELLLAGQYQSAITALKAWLGELETTVKNLHQVIDVVKPAPIS